YLCTVGAAAPNHDCRTAYRNWRCCIRHALPHAENQATTAGDAHRFHPPGDPSIDGKGKTLRDLAKNKPVMRHLRRKKIRRKHETHRRTAQDYRCKPAREPLGDYLHLFGECLRASLSFRVSRRM